MITRRDRANLALRGHAGKLVEMAAYMVKLDDDGEYDLCRGSKLRRYARQLLSVSDELTKMVHALEKEIPWNQ